MSAFFIPSGSPVSFENHTLILPSESVGNVGQLCIDLLTTTLGSLPSSELKRVGYIYSPALLPAVGNDAFATYKSPPTGELCTAMEVYLYKPKQLVFIQQRSTLVKELRKEFVTALVQWMSEQSFSKIFLLASIDANQRRDAQLVGSQFRHTTAPSLMLLDTKFKELGIKPLEAPNVEFLEERVSEKRKQKAMFYGSGIARRVFSQSVVFDLPLSVLFMFCAEGDNSADAYKYADKVNQLVKIIDVPKPTGDIPPEYQSFVPSPWVAPLAWDLFFGAPANSVLF